MVQCGNENLRQLTKDSFQIKTNENGKKYIEMTYNEQTKKNQGDKIAYNVHDGDRHVIFEQPD